MASGDPQNTAPKPKGSGGGKAEKLSQKEQSERFKQTARELDVDETGESFERALKVIVPANKASKG